MIWQIVNFIVLVAIVYKFCKKPFKNFLLNRRDTIKRAVDESSEIKREAERIYIDAQKRLLVINDELERLYKRIQEEAKREGQRIISEAEKAAERIKKQTAFTIEQEVKNARSKIREELSIQSINMAERLIRENLVPEDNRRILKEYLYNLDLSAMHRRGGRND